MNINKEQIRRILIIRLGKLGDVLFTTPLVRALKKALPKAEIIYVVSSYAKPILENNPYINKLLILRVEPKQILNTRQALFGSA